MSYELKLPKELEHLVEKRKRRGRRKADQPAVLPTTQPAAIYKGPERRKRRRRKAGS
jgi:hypothetical protein